MPTGPDARADELAGGSEESEHRGPLPPWLWRGALAVAAVVLAAMFGPGLLASSEQPAPAPEPSGLPSLPASTFATTDPRPAAPLDWKIRGDLQNDEKFLADVLARVQKSDAASAKVLFAAALPDGGRIALVALARSDPVSDMGRGVHMRALHVPANAEPAQGTPVPMGRLIDEGDVTGWAGRGTGGRIFAALLGSPAPLALEASPLIHYHRSGGASRRWRGVSAADGSAVVDLGKASDQIVVVRSSLPDLRTYPLVLSVDHDPRSKVGASTPPPGVSRVEGLRSSGYRGPDPALVVQVVAEGHEYRFDPATADLRVIWSGEVEPGRRAAVVRARRPDGPVFQLLVTDGGASGTSHGPRHVPWETGDLTPWLFVQGDPEKPVLLLNPSGQGTAVLTEAGSPQRRVPIGPDGIGVFAGTQQAQMFTGLSAARLAVVSASGEILVSSSLPSLGIDDVFVLR